MGGMSWVPPFLVSRIILDGEPEDPREGCQDFGVTVVTPSAAGSDGPRPRDMRVAAHGEPQGPEGGLAGVVDADAGARHDLFLPHRLPPGDAERRPVEQDPVELAADCQSPADLARSSGEIAGPGDAGPTPVLAHPLLPGDRLAGPQEHGAADTRLAGDGVQAIVHAVDHVDIGVAAREIEALV